MKLNRYLFLAAFVTITWNAQAQRISLVSGTVINHASDIDRVVKNGVVYPADEVLKSQ